MNKAEMKILLREVLIEMIEGEEIYIDRDIYLTHESRDDFGNADGAVIDMELYLNLVVKDES